MKRVRPALLLLLLAFSACAAPAASPSAPAASSSAPAASSAAAQPSVTSGASPTERPAALSSDPLHAVALVDVRTGETVTIGQLAAARPVLLETMAIWCTNCRGQQREVVAAHGLADFHSISLDVDPNERAEDLTDYADQQGFDWVFAVADATLVQALRERFGTAVLNPPSMPKILFRTDGSVELIGLGEQLSADALAAVVGG